MSIEWQQDSRIKFLVTHDERIWDMGMRLAGIPVVAITTDAVGDIITDGPIPTPTDEFTRMAGYEYVRRGGEITVEVDAFTIAKATLAIRCWPMDELLRIRDEMNKPPVEDIDPTGNGPMAAVIGADDEKGEVTP